jgi:outer membrane protein assembly factor BamB
MLRKLAALGLVCCVLSPAGAANWPQWRGPTANGVAPEGKYPTEWTKSKNVAWKVSLPGLGSSTPIVWGDRIFVTCGANNENVLLCVTTDGKELWQTRIGKERSGKHKKASGSNPSCVTDGKLVYAYFKSGDLAAVTFSGQIVWQKNLQDLFGEDTLWWDLGTSPVLTKETVVIACMQTGPSYLAAFHKVKGELAWKVDRNLDAPEEAAQSYSTPIVVDDNGTETIYVLGADHVTAHAALDGKELWRVKGLNPTGNRFCRSISSPVISDNVLVAPYDRGSALTAIKLGGSGDVTETHVVWRKRDLGADVPTPAATNGRVYLCTDKGKVVCLNIATGDTIWTGELEKNRNAYSSSPILAGGSLYVTREDGMTFVLKDGETFDVVASNNLGEFTVATPVFANSRVYLRTADHLYCVAK